MGKRRRGRGRKRWQSNEEREWAARSGPVYTVQGGTQHPTRTTSTHQLDGIDLAREQIKKYTAPRWKIVPTSPSPTGLGAVHTEQRTTSSPPRTPLSGDRDLLALAGELIPPRRRTQEDT